MILQFLNIHLLHTQVPLSGPEITSRSGSITQVAVLSLGLLQLSELGRVGRAERGPFRGLPSDSERLHKWRLSARRSGGWRRHGLSLGPSLKVSLSRFLGVLQMFCRAPFYD